jgi:hypothetical protein
MWVSEVYMVRRCCVNNQQNAANRSKSQQASRLQTPVLEWIVLDRIKIPSTNREARHEFRVHPKD